MQFISQLAQFTSVEQQTYTAESTQTMASGQNNATAIALIGHTVDYTDPKNTYTEGHFAFQHHDPTCHVLIRKVEVMELPDSEKK